MLLLFHRIFLRLENLLFCIHILPDKMVEDEQVYNENIVVLKSRKQEKESGRDYLLKRVYLSFTDGLREYNLNPPRDTSTPSMDWIIQELIKNGRKLCLLKMS